MKRSLSILVAFGLAVVGVAVASAGAGAAASPTPVVAITQTISLPYATPLAGKTDVYAVHGLNLAGQTTPAAGGTDVTVCANGAVLIADFQFGQISPKVTLDTGATIALKVFVGANQPCTGTSPLISQDVTVPDVDAVALVATSGPGTFAPTLAPFVLDVTTPPACFPVPAKADAVGSDARLQAVHAAAAGPVTLSVDGSTLPGTLAYGATASNDVPSDIYTVAVNLNGTPIVGPVDLDLAACTSTVAYVVGNQAPPTPTTTTTSTTTSTTTTTTPPSAAAAAVAATPRFTG